MSEHVFLSMERLFRNLGIEDDSRNDETFSVRQIRNAASGAIESDARRKRRGFWEIDGGAFYCNNCKIPQKHADNYCRKCGVEMLTITGDIARIKRPSGGKRR